MTLLYDKDADVLYVAVDNQPDSGCVYAENENEDIVRIDPETNVVVGCTVLSFSERAAAAEIAIPDVGRVCSLGQKKLTTTDVKAGHDVRHEERKG